ncbi:MAG: TIGR04255 family protein [Enterobacteriaceae bacterium]|nr:TIGR04255 family protein [Enterobacteriaceae bacterium]
MQNVSPLNEQNAIQNVAFAIEFSEQVPSEVVQNFIAFHKKDAQLRSAFPRMQPLEMMSMQVGSMGVTFPASIKSIAGVTFDKLLPDGTQEVAILLRPDALIFHCSKYESWATVSTLAFKTLQNLASLCDKLKVSAIGLEYLDVFKVLSIDKSGWLRELFNPESEYIPKHLIDSTGFWHCNQGFFSKAGDAQYELLNNFMIDCIPGDGTKLVQLRSQHKVQSLINSQLRVLFDKNEAQRIFTCAHDITKDSLTKILSDSMLKTLGVK